MKPLRQLIVGTHVAMHCLPYRMVKLQPYYSFALGRYNAWRHNATLLRGAQLVTSLRYSIPLLFLVLALAACTPAPRRPQQPKMYRLKAQRPPASPRPRHSPPAKPPASPLLLRSPSVKLPASPLPRRSLPVERTAPQKSASPRNRKPATVSGSSLPTSPPPTMQ